MGGTSGTHRPWTWLLVLLVLSSGLAGCLGSDDTTTDDASDPNPSIPETDDGPTTLPWGLSTCKAVVAIVPVEAAALSAHLPEGIEPMSGEEAFGLPPDPRGQAALGLETFQCEAGATLTGSRSPMAYGSLFTPVHPPEDVDASNVDIVFYKWETLVPDTPRRDELASNGLPVVKGSVDLSGMEVTPLGTHLFDVSLDLDGAAFTFAGTAGQPNEDFRNGLPFLELQTANEGLATWSTLENNATDANSGTGTVTLPSNHWTADVVGSDTTQAFMVASTNVNFGAASIVLP